MSENCFPRRTPDDDPVGRALLKARTPKVGLEVTREELTLLTLNHGTSHSPDMKLLTPWRVLQQTNTSLLFCLLLIIRSSEPHQSKRKLQLLSETHFQLSIELYNEVAKSRRNDNILISAHNVNLGLALLFLGTTANSTSSRELRNSVKSFHIPLPNFFAGYSATKTAFY